MYILAPNLQILAGVGGISMDGRGWGRGWKVDRKMWKAVEEETGKDFGRERGAEAAAGLTREERQEDG